MAMPSCDAIHQRAAGGFVRGVKRQEFQSSFGTDGILHRVRLVLLNVSGDHRCAFVEQRKRDRAAKSAGTAGDEGYFVGEFAGHRDLLCLWYSFSVKSTSGMLMNFVVDDDHLMRLIEEAQKLGQHQTQEDAVETALKEYIRERQQQHT